MRPLNDIKKLLCDADTMAQLLNEGGLMVTMQQVLTDTQDLFDEVTRLTQDLAEERAVQASANVSPVALRTGEAEAMRSLLMTIRAECSGVPEDDYTARGFADRIAELIDNTLRITEANLR
jgi:hypothetical protein